MTLAPTVKPAPLSLTVMLLASRPVSRSGCPLRNFGGSHGVPSGAWPCWKPSAMSTRASFAISFETALRTVAGSFFSKLERASSLPMSQPTDTARTRGSGAGSSTRAARPG
jgi:hypothetical protein